MTVRLTTFPVSLRAYLEECADEGQAGKAAGLIVARIRKLEAQHRYKDPKDLLEAVLKRFKRYCSPGDDLFEPGPWSGFIVCATWDKAGALVLMRNVIKAELEGVLPERWTA